MAGWKAERNGFNWRFAINQSLSIPLSPKGRSWFTLVCRPDLAGGVENLQNSLHDDLTRAPLHRRYASLKQCLIVAAVLFLVAAVTALAPRLAHSAAEIELSRAPDPIVPDRNIVHDIAIELVDPGREGLELSARLSDEGGLIQRPIDWRIRSAEGEPVFEGQVGIADVALVPGDYRIEARYGTAALARDLTLLEGNRLIVSFVLDVGGLRVLPRLQGMGFPGVKAESLVYAADGRRRGELITTSTVPGEIVRVKAGLYRIESRFAAGNAVAVTDVTVRPGLLSAVEIDHVAGLARLAAGRQVRWTVTGDDGVALEPIEGASAQLVLKPGAYTVLAELNGATRASTFTIAAGKEIEILVEMP